ncbi:triose-phosphate isomerase [Streptomonospora litoralis]|uniref:Triosephosphate isomerase n=1 Tax=Streptomonospora litoralis TaxID=2498135 RepID=A0A4P6Q2Z7_9ACTN|nr:triose-phosphate isomerase [Streptomonospora litoralis]QBI55038.1 Triosephosphate isomerase [Streptomonospora litoralis]
MAEPKRKPLIAGNWKLNNNHLEAIALVQKLAFTLNDADFDTAEIVVLPPFTNLRSVQTLVDGDKLKIGYGAQDISAQEKGAYTGEISGSMLAKLGCTYALAGHSERREYHQEDDAVVNGKVKAAFAADITPILCLGEGLDVRKAGEHVPHTLAQLDGALKDVPAEQAARLVVAYEPVWAIGTGEVATPQDAQEVCRALRGRLGELYSDEVAGATRILYGGSVKGDNIAGIMDQDDVDGALVGGASLKPEEFVKLARLGRE